MKSDYLAAIDEALAGGLAGLSEDFRARHAAFVASCQQADGGFAGRTGPSDLYYTDFALRTLALLAPDHPAIARCVDYLRARRDTATDVVSCFNGLNCARLAGIEVDGAAIHAAIERHRLSSGAFARPGGKHPSAYHTFLAALCYEMLDQPAPAAAEAILPLQRAEGGFTDTGEGQSQTSSTAAAIGFLRMTDAIGPDRLASAAAFLATMQRPDGGLAAHADLTDGDLLSTFTGMLTLAGLGELARVDLTQAARFLRGCACPTGGFGANPGDGQADAEYTYYGLGVLAILRASRD